MIFYNSFFSFCTVTPPAKEVVGPAEEEEDEDEIEIVGSKSPRHGEY